MPIIKLNLYSSGLVKRVNGAIDNNLEAVEGNVPLAAGEMHAKKIVRKDGKMTYQNYNWAGPGTKVEERLAKGIRGKISKRY